MAGLTPTPTPSSIAAGSALVGQPPNNQNDYYIIRGFARLMGIPDQALDPHHGFPQLMQAPFNEHYTSQAPGMIASMSVTIALVVLITGTRVGLRVFRRHLRWGYDDIMIVPAAIGAVAWFGCVIGMAAQGGAGKHFYDVTYDELYWFFRLAAIGQVIFWVTVALIYLSITLFNRRLTGLTSPRWQYAHNTFLTLITVYLIIALFTNLFQCRPLLIQYSLVASGRAAGPPTCLPSNPLGIALSSVHIFFEFALLAVPLLVLYIIRMSTSKKIRLSFLFSIGSLSCVGAVMRQVLQKQADPDLTWAFPQQMAWSTVDLFFAITAASLPVLNAAVPKSWRSPVHSVQVLGNLSILRTRRSGTRRLDSDERVSRADGTVLTREEEEEEVRVLAEERARRAGDRGAAPGVDVEKDSYHLRTEKRWDEAFNSVQTPVPTHRLEFDPRAKGMP